MLRGEYKLNNKLQIIKWRAYYEMNNRFKSWISKGTFSSLREKGKFKNLRKEYHFERSLFFR